ncbi:uncharacterized protein G2W53_023254 [Senna tora]|uniref:Uncharacterized protein n=1 Tax=Senna tora TaxID=362788 RepID=A0A834TI25_9FABA|nr:uncharacterized protein G2W53_023254 [Senna tora]
MAHTTFDLGTRNMITLLLEVGALTIKEKQPRR